MRKKNVNWSEWFTYNDGKLIWNKCTSATGSGPNQPGKVAGCTKHRLGYPIVNLHKVTYLQHRIIWEMHYGTIPDHLTIDHIDRDRSNNRLSNLRLVDVYLQNSNRDSNLRNNPLTGRFERISNATK